METNQTNGVNSWPLPTHTVCAGRRQGSLRNVITHCLKLFASLLAAADMAPTSSWPRCSSSTQAAQPGGVQGGLPGRTSCPVKKPVVEQIVVPETEVEEEEESLESKMKRLQTEMEASSWDDDEEEPVVVQDVVQDEVQDN